jgi:hypothetical protein
MSEKAENEDYTFGNSRIPRTEVENLANEPKSNNAVVFHLRSKCQEALPKYSIYIYIV